MDRLKNGFPVLPDGYFDTHVDCNADNEHANTDVDRNAARSLAECHADTDNRIPTLYDYTPHEGSDADPDRC